MNASDLQALAPLLIITSTAVVLMLLASIHRSHRITLAVSLSGIALAFASLWPAWDAAPRQVTSLLLFDDFAFFYMGLLLAITGMILLFTYGYLERQTEHKEEFYILTFLSTAGAMVLVASDHFASFFLGLELLSVSLYALVAYLRSGSACLEAGIKYLVLASSSAAFLLFGMALIYGEVGSMELSAVAAFLGRPFLGPRSIIALAGVVLIITGVGFKLALVPFHLWTPDVYQGAPLPVTSLIATVSKASVFGLLLRWLHPVPSQGNAIWIVLAISAAASMIAGNLLALYQTNVKRILAYSSIAHMGYFFVAFLAGGALGFQAATYYLIAYLVTITGAFGVLTVLCSREQEFCEIDDYRGLFWSQPLLAGILTAMLFSLAGIPLTAGFLGKFYVIASGASAGVWTLLLILIASSVIGLYYYLRIVVSLYAQAYESQSWSIRSIPASVSLAGLTLCLFYFGVYPSWLWHTISLAVSGLK